MTAPISNLHLSALSTAALLQEIQYLENEIEYTTCFDQHPLQGQLIRCYQELDARSCTADYVLEPLRGK